VAGSVDVREFLEGFLGEADEHLTRIASNLAICEGAPERSHPRALVELLRSLHTLKGLAGMMGVEPVVELSHAMESVVRAADRGGGIVPSAAIDPLVAATKAIALCVRALAEGKPVPAAPDPVLAALEALGEAVAGGGASPPPAPPSEIPPELAAQLTRAELDELQQAHAHGERACQVTFVPSPAKAEAGRTITTVRTGIGTLGRIVRVLPRTVPRSDAAPGGLEFVILVVTADTPERVAAAAGVAEQDVVSLGRAEDAPPRANDAPPRANDDDAFDRVSRRGVVRMDVAGLDEALEHLSALGIGQLRLRQEARTLGAGGADTRGLTRQLDAQDRQLGRMRVALLQLRMVPLREVLEPLPLIVRGLRNTTGKRVRLVVEVGDAELDKTVAERLLPALVHLVRNAIDHGIEAEEARRTHGKPEEGLLRVEAAAPASAMLEISITDDGAGIDAERVAARAGRAVPKSDMELLEILTMPGFSTREVATTTSGRGIGLDVVRHTVESLGGALELDNRPGRGVTLRIRAPLTVAILDAFAFVAGQERYLAPIAVIDAIVDVDDAQVVRPPGPEDARSPSLLHARGDLMPLVSLRAVLGRPATGDERKAMIVRHHGRPFAFGIERMLGQHQVLVRPLADPLVTVPGVSGSADLGDGRPTLVLDLPALTGRLGHSGAGVRA
jgi:two-component system chemotaxis sensor kinase CheA